MSIFSQYRIDELYAARDAFNHELFRAELDAAGIGVRKPVYGPRVAALQRSIELALSSNPRKVWLVGQHARVCLEHLEYFKRQHVDSEPDSFSSMAYRFRTLYPEMPSFCGARLDPVFTPDMLETFPELHEYAARWDGWQVDYQNMLASVIEATIAIHPKKRQGEMRLELYRSRFDEFYDELAGLLRDLIGLVETP